MELSRTRRRQKVCFGQKRRNRTCRPAPQVAKISQVVQQQLEVEAAKSEAAAAAAEGLHPPKYFLRRTWWGLQHICCNRPSIGLRICRTHSDLSTECSAGHPLFIGGVGGPERRLPVQRSQAELPEDGHPSVRKPPPRTFSQQQQRASLLLQRIRRRSGSSSRRVKLIF